MGHAIEKRRRAPVSRTAPDSLGVTAGALSAVTRGPGIPGPNSSGVLSDGTAVTARPLSVSVARRTGPGAFVGATSQTAPRSSGPGGGRGAPAAAPPARRPPTRDAK